MADPLAMQGRDQRPYKARPVPAHAASDRGYDDTVEVHRDPPQEREGESPGKPSGGAKAFFVGLGIAVVALYLDGKLLDAEGLRTHPFGFEAVRALLHTMPWLVAAWIALRGGGSFSERLWGFVGIGGLLGLLLLANWVFRPRLHEHTRQSPFTSEAWHADAVYREGRADSEERIHMIEDLMERRLLDGLTKDEVLTLLGPDDGPEGTARASHYFAEWDLRYRLGPIRFMPVDDEWLVVRFGDDGLVKEYEVVTD